MCKITQCVCKIRHCVWNNTMCTKLQIFNWKKKFSVEKFYTDAVGSVGDKFSCVWTWPNDAFKMVCFDFVELESFHQRDAVFNIHVCFDLFGPDENLEFITKKKFLDSTWSKTRPQNTLKYISIQYFVGSYLIFVIFFTRAKFLENKI